MTVDRSRVTSVAAGPVRRARPVRRLWGDEEAGFVDDRVYVSSEQLYQIVLAMPPGAAFRHSEENRTIFGGDELYYVLRGRLLLSNPETGEVVPLEQGQAAWFGPDTWHHGFAFAPAGAEVLEFFAPPPAAGMSQAYARTKPYLEEGRYARDARPPVPTIRPLDPRRSLRRVEGERASLLVGTLLATPRLTVAVAELLPLGESGARRHLGDLGLYVVAGELDVRLPTDEGFRLGTGDGFFVPGGTGYALANGTDAPTAFLFAVAPSG